MAETLADHMFILESILDHFSTFRYEDDSLDQSEAQWYEPWDMILNWLRLRSSRHLSVAPQIRLTAIIYHQQGMYFTDSVAEKLISTHESDDTRSIDANVGSDAAPEDKPGDLDRISRIPDFGVFYTKGDKRLLPLLVEVKTNDVDNPYRTMQNMIKQTLVQARHVFEIYGGHKNLRGPSTCRLYVFCVVEMSFWMYRVEREDLQFLPEAVSHSRESLRVRQFVRRIRAQVDVWPVFNNDMTDYSRQFRNCWKDFTDDLPIEEP